MFALKSPPPPGVSSALKVYNGTLWLRAANAMDAIAVALTITIAGAPVPAGGAEVYCMLAYTYIQLHITTSESFTCAHSTYT